MRLYSKMQKRIKQESRVRRLFRKVIEDGYPNIRYYIGTVMGKHKAYLDSLTGH